MSHRNARLNVRGRQLVVQRVCEQGWAVARGAKAQDVSRQCAHRWIARLRTEGGAGLYDRSSRPRYCPRQTPATVEEAIVAKRRDEHRGQARLAESELGTPPGPCHGSYAVIASRTCVSMTR